MHERPGQAGARNHRLRLTFSQLEVFIATARTGSTRSAAACIGRSQSATSDALTELEATLGMQVFDRAGRRLLLNGCGRALLPRAVALVEQAGEVEVLFALEDSAPLRLASSYTIGEYLMPELICRWKRAHPRSQVRLEIANTRRVLDAVAAFEVDIGFVEGGGTHPDLSVSSWLDDELVVVASPCHLLAAGRVSSEQLAAATWIVREQGSGTREATDRWLTAGLGRLQVELELGSNEAVKRAVASGLGLGCLSRLAISSAAARGELVEVHTHLPPMQRVFSIVVHRTKLLGTTTQAFLEHCCSPSSISGLRDAEQNP